MKGKSLQSAGAFVGQATLSEVTWGGHNEVTLQSSLLAVCVTWVQNLTLPNLELSSGRRSLFDSLWDAPRILRCARWNATLTVPIIKKPMALGRCHRTPENISLHFCLGCLREDNGYTHANSIKKSPVNVREYHGMLRFIWLLHCLESFVDEPWSPWLTWLHSVVSDIAG